MVYATLGEGARTKAGFFILALKGGNLFKRDLGMRNKLSPFGEWDRQSKVISI